MDRKENQPQFVSQPSKLSNELAEKYEILGRLSEGGMGAIYKAVDKSTGTHNAIKILHPEFDNNKGVQLRFAKEARLMRGLVHPNLCRFHDAGITASGTSYLAMEWIDGINLRTRVNRDGPLSPDEVVAIFRQAAAGLAYAHTQRLVHRDLKPENIMLTPGADGNTVVHLVDFGIAKREVDGASSSPEGVTKSGVIVGTPLFMSPEQGRAMPVDQRSDVYSLGCVMWFALTGTPPFDQGCAVDIIYQHVSNEIPKLPADLKVPESLTRVIYKAMEKAPADRYQSMEELEADLIKVSKGVKVKHAPLAQERKKRQKIIMSVVYFILGFLLMSAISIGVQSLSPENNQAQNSSPKSSPQAK